MLLSMSAKLSTTNQIKKLIADSNPPKHIAIISTDRILRERTLSLLAEGLKLKAGDKWLFDIKKIKLGQAKEQDLKNFILESNAISFFSKQQIFIIEDLEKVTEKQTDLLVKLLEKKTTTDFFIFLGTQLNSRSRLVKYFEDHSALFDLPKQTPAGFKDWIKQEFRDRNLQPEPQAIEMLTSSSDLSIDLAIKKIDQLELFADNPKITAKMLELVFPSELINDEWAWKNSIAAGNKIASQKFVSIALAEGKEALGLTATLQSMYLNYFLIYSLRQQGQDKSEIQKILNISGKSKDWIYDKQAAFASQKGPKRLINDLKVIVRADSKLKNKSLGSEIILHELVNSLS